MASKKKTEAKTSAKDTSTAEERAEIGKRLAAEAVASRAPVR